MSVIERLPRHLAALIATVAMIGAGLGIGAATAAGPAVAAAAPSSIGYTTVVGDGTCRLATVDLAGGTLTPLPAASSPAACATDLAVASSGAVYGIDRSLSADPLAGPDLVTYGADGSAGRRTIDVVGTDLRAVQFGGIAVTADGAVLIQMVVGNVAACAPNSGPAAVPAIAVPSLSVCLLQADLTGTGSVVATPIGPSGLALTPLVGLAECGGVLRTIIADGPTGTLGVQDRGTGVVTPGATVTTPPVGIDCPPGSGAPYVLSASAGPLGGPAGAVSLGTVDPATGQVTAIAALSDPTAVRALAVGPTPALPPPTAPSAQAAAATATAPSFTG